MTYDFICFSELLYECGEDEKTLTTKKSTTPTRASGYVVLIRWLQSALIPSCYDASVGVLNPPHE